MRFRDRAEAGRRLGEALLPYGRSSPVILALPRGGVPVAVEIARALGAPMDLVIVRKIGVPARPELAMGAVVDTRPPALIRNDQVIEMAHVSAAEFAAVCEWELAEARRRRARYLRDRPAIDLAHRTAILVDDGVATGASMRAALVAVRQKKPKQIVVAVPVAPPETIAALQEEADDVVCLEIHSQFDAIGSYYADFGQIDDEEVIALLQSLTPAVPAPQDMTRACA